MRRTPVLPLRRRFYIRLVVANVVANLLETPEDRKVGNRIGKNDLAAQRQAGRDTGHILFSNSGIQEAARKPFGKGLDDAKTQVANDQEDTLVALGQSV